MVAMETLLNGGRSLLRLQFLLVFCIACVPTVLSQHGFLSIDCGSNESYTDSSTGIFWSTDANYTLTGRNVDVEVKELLSGTIVNMRQMGTLRYFDDPRSRDCYVLPVQKGETYLLRLSFYFGNLPDYGSFEIWVDYNNWLYLDWQQGTNRYTANWYEFIYFAPRSSLNVCLDRLTGPFAFISALELRQLARGMYSAVVGPKLTSWLFLNERINCGPSETGPIQLWRYPNDTYDRFWTLDGYDFGTPISNPNISASSNSATEDPDLPPLVVMETGWVASDSDILSIAQDTGNPLGPVYTAAYFQDLDNNASKTSVRGMSYYLNSQFIQSFNISDEPLEIDTTGNIQDTYLNMSFVRADWSHLRPTLNAFEVYYLEPYYNDTTFYEDVVAVGALQVRLNLSDWTGDPCLPHAYDWMNCSPFNRTHPPRITNISLENQGLQGTFPREIENLTALTTLNFNNNSFTGSIPDFSNLVHLEAIYLQNNKLNGEIPAFLGNAFPNLTQLNLDNNNLSGSLPSDLINNPRLHFTVLNNPLITHCTVSACGATTSPSTHSSGTNTGVVVGGILGGLAGLAIVAGIAWMIGTRKQRARSSIIKAIGQAESQRSGSIALSNRGALVPSLAMLTLQEVSDATKRFSKKIGEGSFGPVYYGKLWNGREVAVKVKKTDSHQGIVEFLNEVELLSRIHHRNLVSLVGYCDEENQKILIYVYVSNGTLRDHLYGDQSRKRLNWNTRLDIALNSAKGLEYLHTDCDPRIIHRDVKSSNILLDENMVAKVADFGISKQAPEGVFTGVDTILKGTIGYLDPAYFASQRLTQKSDVYSFGVVLLEIISGRHPYIMELPNGTSCTLIEWVYGAVNNGSAMDVIDPSLHGKFNKESMMTILSLAISSIDPITAKRPTMAQVVRAITSAIELELPSNVIDKTGDDSTSPSVKDKGKEIEDDIFDLKILPGSEEPVDPSIILLR